MGQYEDLATQSEVPGAAAAAACPESPLEMQSLHPRPTESEYALEQGPQVIHRHYI